MTPIIAVLLGTGLTFSCGGQQRATDVTGSTPAKAERTVVIQVGKMMKSKSGAT